MFECFVQVLEESATPKIDEAFMVPNSRLLRLLSRRTPLREMILQDVQ